MDTRSYRGCIKSGIESVEEGTEEEAAVVEKATRRLFIGVND